MSKGPRLFLPDGRGLGRLPDKTPRVAAIPRSGLELPDSELREFIDATPLQIKDQNGKGACNGHAAVTAIEYARWVAGMPYVPLSAWYVYAILCNGVDRGSMILDALELTSAKGAPPEPLVAYGVIDPRRLTDEAHTAATRFRVEIGKRLETWREIISAVRLRRPLNFSLLANAAFDRLDSEGVAGATRGVGNHAVMLGGGLKKSAKHGWVARMRNSWTEQWGDDGMCWISEKHWANQSYSECYEIVAVKDDSTIDNPPGVR